jgi:hypothetical protein
MNDINEEIGKKTIRNEPEKQITTKEHHKAVIAGVDGRQTMSPKTQVIKRGNDGRRSTIPMPDRHWIAGVDGRQTMSPKTHEQRNVFGYLPHEWKETESRRQPEQQTQRRIEPIVRNSKQTQNKVDNGADSQWRRSTNCRQPTYRLTQ